MRTQDFERLILSVTSDNYFDLPVASTKNVTISIMVNHVNSDLLPLDRLFTYINFLCVSATLREELQFTSLENR